MPHSGSEESAPQPTGVVERLVRDDTDRKRFLKAVGVGGAASFGAFVLAACGSSSSSSSSPTTAASATATAAASTATSSGSPAGDVAILNYALTLEYLETQFYNKVIAAKLFTGAAGSLVKSFGEQEQTHVEAIKAVLTQLGATPVAEPTGKFPVTTPAAVANLAYTVENLGAAAYLGQAAAIQSKSVLAAALSIHSVEARHAATFATLVSKPITPNGAFAAPADMATVLATVKPFLA